ncbi:MAG TPA: hypothetical protein PK295_00485 [Candidatus Magasanikbacteria bacterium]|nr:hypothetical protein [Candidatus Magasanikbacteria bacterium]
MSEAFERSGVPQEEIGKEQQTQNNEGQEEVDIQKEYVSNLRKVEKMDEKISEALVGVKEEDEKMRKLRESMGLPSEDTKNTSTEEYVETLEQQREYLDKEISGQEQEILQVPSSEGRNPSTLEKRMDIVDSSIEGLEKEAREKFVQEFITSSVTEITDHFRTFLDQSQNKEAAEFLIQQKLTFSIQQRAEDYIENGGEPDFGFEAEISGQEFDDAEKGDVMYITEFNVTFNQLSSVSESEKFQPKQELIDEHTQQQMDQAEENGELEKIEKEAA